MIKVLDGIDGLERGCIEPGLWLVEGHQVRKVPGSRGPWLVIRLRGGQDPRDPIAMTRTFREALEGLVDHLNAAQGCDC
jgi:hypothetical protein